MVLTGNLSPDPSNRPEDNFSPTEMTMPVLTSSDSEEEEISYEGYEVLPQDFSESNFQHNENDYQDSNSIDANEVDIILNTTREISAFDQATKSELTDLWNSTNKNRLTDIIIDSAKEEEIKKAMAGFKLPSTAIPPWAEHIPEEEWKEKLISKVVLLNKLSTS